MPKYIVVGADPRAHTNHHGGVLTLCAGLFDYASERGITLTTINTLRLDMSPISTLSRIRMGMSRVRQLFSLFRNDSTYQGAILFTGAGFSFFERTTLALLCRFFQVSTIMIIVDGAFVNVRRSNPLYRYLISVLLRVPNKQLASGQQWVDLFKDLGLREARVLHTLYWLPRTFKVIDSPKSASLDRPLRFVFVGWLIKEKGVEELLSAIDLLRGRFQFEFTFVGGGELLDSVRNHIKLKEWTSEVSVLGWVDNSEFQQLLESQDVFVLPSYSEGFPMSLIEAFSKGLPAIVSDVGGVSDSLVSGKNGYLIKPRDTDSLVEAMERYLKNPKLLDVQSIAALDTIKSNHNLNTNCDLIFTALRK
ncbi:glycosyltransferase [Desulfosediminicola sp.]|uniref:glycosyltransferase n=1 Tax=Desulfosediminicola sp. TaxID=2886825 RepID=UPI003AF2C8D3